MTDTPMHKMSKTQAGLALLILTAIIVSAAIVSAPKSISSNTKSVSKTVVKPPKKQIAATVPAKTGSTTTQNTTTTDSSPYKDDSYSATGDYYSPGGEESVAVSLTLQNGVVVASNVQSGANDPTASSYQSIFISNYKPYVIGKKINDIKLSNVSGSSLTPQGFNNALKQIEHQAEA
jgi:hypothetical protein